MKFQDLVKQILEDEGEESDSSDEVEASSDTSSKKKKHPGFSAVRDSIMKKGGYDKETASKILASKTRNASAIAKAKNPNLNKVK
jgi:hypothetical protein